MKSGFVYIWRDSKKGMYYLGSHMGDIDDGYTGSGMRFQSAYQKRPESFTRRILEFHENISHSELREREEHWLSMIDDTELGTRYYNLKKVAAGGDIYSTLSEEAKEQHRIKSRMASRKFWDNISEEEYKKRQRNAFGGNTHSRDYLRERNKKLCAKKAVVIHPCGKKETVTNIAEFCQKHNLNYGNMKNVLRGNTAAKSCKKFRGHYV